MAFHFPTEKVFQRYEYDPWNLYSHFVTYWLLDPVQTSWPEIYLVQDSKNNVTLQGLVKT